jgi:three-Cys-motif partner protein
MFHAEIYKMAHNSFGGLHTEVKLLAVEKYLNAFTTALKKEGFRLLYFDGFAGSGNIQASSEIPLIKNGEDADLLLTGSVIRALRVAHPFDEYVFIEKSAAKRAELENVVERERPESASIRYVPGDANNAVLDFCRKTNWSRCRAVIFLDPFGNQVGWKTLEAIANTKADLWYLFPAGLGVSRLISGDGSVDPGHRASLDRLFDGRRWEQALIEETGQADLFDTDVASRRKIATPEKITKFMIHCMKEPFGGRVLDQWLPLVNSRGGYLYSLLFAMANDSERAWPLGRKLAAAVLRRRR